MVVAPMMLLLVDDCKAALTHWTVCPSNSRSDRLFMLLLGGTVIREERIERDKIEI